MSKSDEEFKKLESHSQFLGMELNPSGWFNMGWASCLEWAQQPGPCGHPQGCTVKRGEGVYELVCLVCEAERKARDRALDEAENVLLELKDPYPYRLIHRLRAVQVKSQMTGDQFKDIAL